MTRENASLPERPCLTRRGFLLAGGTAGATVLLTVPGVQWPVWAKTAGYPRKTIGKVSQLKMDAPVYLTYPDDESPILLVKLGVPAGGGVGAEKDIVAFSALCTHMGSSLEETYKPQHKGVGPCPLHLTSYDLTRHGIVVAGHATESLPQVLLETDGDDIVAKGVMGLVYGRAANLS